MSPEDRAINIRAEFSEFENLSSDELNKCCHYAVGMVIDGLRLYDKTNSEELTHHMNYWYNVQKKFK